MQVNDAIFRVRNSWWRVRDSDGASPILADVSERGRADQCKTWPLAPPGATSRSALPAPTRHATGRAEPDQGLWESHLLMSPGTGHLSLCLPPSRTVRWWAGARANGKNSRAGGKRTCAAVHQRPRRRAQRAERAPARRSGVLGCLLVPTPHGRGLATRRGLVSGRAQRLVGRLNTTPIPHP